MLTDDFTIPNVLGLHARAAAKLNSIACRYNASLQVKKDTKAVDARNIMGLLTLGAAKGNIVTISVEGEEEQQAMAAVRELFARKFDEQ